MTRCRASHRRFTYIGRRLPSSVAAGAIALAAAAAAPAAAQEFVIGRDVPLRNAIVAGEPGPAVTARTAPDTSRLREAFGALPATAEVIPLSDGQVAEVVGEGNDAWNPAVLAGPQSGADLAQGSLLSSGQATGAGGTGIGATVSGALQSGLGILGGIGSALPKIPGPGGG